MIYLEPSPQSVWDKKELIRVYKEGTTHTIGMVTTNSQWVLDVINEAFKSHNEKEKKNVITTED